MKLNEVLDKPFPWKWLIKKANDNYKAAFKVDSYNYLWSGRYDVTIDEWSIMFANTSVKGSMKVTETGNEFRVFATVMAITKDFIKLEEPDIIEFSAKEGNRGKLYTVLIKKYSQSLGYKVKSVKVNTGPLGMMVFRLEKI